MGEELYERTEKQIVDNADIPLFSIGDKPYGVKVRPIATIDAWLSDADEIMQLGSEVLVLLGLASELQQAYIVDFSRFQERKIRDPKPGETPVTEEDVQQAKARADEANAYARTQRREYMNRMLECLCAYDPARLVVDEIRNRVTDGQILSAFSRLRFFSDPLAAQRIVTAALTRARAATER